MPAQPTSSQPEAIDVSKCRISFVSRDGSVSIPSYDRTCRDPRAWTMIRATFDFKYLKFLSSMA